MLNTIEKEQMKVQPSQLLSKDHLHTYSLVCNTSRVLLSLSAFLPSIAVGSIVGPVYGVVRTCNMLHTHKGWKWALPLSPLCALVGFLGVVLHYTTLHCTAIHYTTLHYTTLYTAKQLSSAHWDTELYCHFLSYTFPPWNPPSVWNCAEGTCMEEEQW